MSCQCTCGKHVLIDTSKWDRDMPSAAVGEALNYQVKFPPMTATAEAAPIIAGAVWNPAAAVAAPSVRIRIP